MVSCSLTLHYHVGVITWTLLYTQLDQPMLPHFAHLFHVAIPGSFLVAYHLPVRRRHVHEIHHAPSPWAVFSYKLVNFNNHTLDLPKQPENSHHEDDISGIPSRKLLVQWHLLRLRQWDFWDDDHIPCKMVTPEGPEHYLDHLHW